MLLTCKRQHSPYRDVHLADVDRHWLLGTPTPTSSQGTRDRNRLLHNLAVLPA